MTGRLQTLPNRDIEHGAGSKEANRIWGGDIKWMAEAVGARGGSTPGVSVDILRAMDLLGIYSDLGQFGYYWVDSDYSPGEVYLPSFVDQWGPESLSVTEAKKLVPARNTIDSGKPLLGDDMRRAFYNFQTHEQALFGKSSDSWDVFGATYEPIDHQTYTPHSKADVLLHTNGGSATVPYWSGFKISGGTFSFTPSGIPQNTSDWDIAATFAVLACNSSGEGAISFNLVSGEFSEGRFYVQASDVLAAAYNALAHRGIGTGPTDAYFAYLQGFVVLLRVAENYMLSDLGWGFQP